MKTKIAILGSTGSIGKNLLKILNKKKDYDVILLSTNKNYKLILKQAITFKVKNIIINKKSKKKIGKNTLIKKNYLIW